MDRQRVLAELREERAEVESQLAELRLKLVGVRARIHALESGGRIVGGKEHRTDNVVALLSASDEPLGPTAISKMLNKAGDPATPKDVRGTLGYLREQGRVDRIARGQWIAT